MPVFDQIETDSSQVHSGTYTDIVVEGNVFNITTSLGKRVVGNHIGSLHQNFFEQRRRFSRYLHFVSGAFKGRDNKTTQAFSSKEQYFDSFFPPPTGIVKSDSDLKFVFPDGSGSTEASPDLGIGAEPDNAVPFFMAIGSDYDNLSSTQKTFVNLDWMHSPWPFRSTYRTLSRTFKLSTKLDSKVPLERTIGGDSVSDEFSNELGSIYYILNDAYSFGAPMTLRGTPNGGTSVVFRKSDVYTIESNYSASFSAGGMGSINEMTVVTASISATEHDNFPVAMGIAQSTISSSYCTTTDGYTWRAEAIDVRSLGIPFAQVTDIAHGVDNTSPLETFSGYVIVCATGSAEGAILYSTGKKIPERDDWSVATYTAGTPDRFRIVAFNDPAGEESSSNYTAFADSGTPWYSTDITGSEWTQGTAPTGLDFTGMCYGRTSGTRRFIAVGSLGIVATSNSRTGDTWTMRTSGTAQPLFAVASRYTTGGSTTTIAVGDNNTIIRSTNLGSTWSTISTPFLGSDNLTEISVVNDINSDLDWIGVGWGWARNPTVFVFGSTDDGLTWSEITFDPKVIGLDDTFSRFGPIAASVVDPGTQTHKSTPFNILVGGGGRVSYTTPTFRLIDFDFTQFVTENTISDTGIKTAGKVTNLATKYRNHMTIGPPLRIKNNLSDFNKCFFGFGDGLSFTPPTIYTITIGFGGSKGDTAFHIGEGRKRFPKFKQIGWGFGGDGVFETAYLIGPIVRGYGYGIYNGVPTSTKAVFRKNRFGQLRDMLEQRPYTKFLLTDKGNSTSQAAVNVKFVSGTLTHNRSVDYLTASNPDYNPTDSGQFDFEYKSGQPFFDDIDLTLAR
jgi:hypothetical protein